MAWAPDNFKTELQLASEIMNISCVKSVAGAENFNFGKTNKNTKFCPYYFTFSQIKTSIVGSFVLIYLFLSPKNCFSRQVVSQKRFISTQSNNKDLYDFKMVSLKRVISRWRAVFLQNRFNYTCIYKNVNDLVQKKLNTLNFCRGL